MSSLPINTDAIQQPLLYQSSQFINREQELKIVEKNIFCIQNKDVVHESLINFWGISGTGKTWLLRHLHHLYTYDNSANTIGQLRRPTYTMYCSFPQVPSLALVEIVKCLASETLHQLSAVLSPEDQEIFQQISRSGHVNTFTTKLRELSSRFLPLILLDNAERVLPESWEEAERFLVEPLIRTGQILIVVAGRRQAPRWRRFEVRRRAMDARKSRVHPFSKEDVLKQVAIHHYRLPVNLLYPYTAGNPHLVDTLARNFEMWADENGQTQYDQAWLDAHQPSLLAILHPSKERLLEQVPPALSEALEAISPLRFYRLEAVRYMLIAQDKADVTDADNYFLNLVRELDAKTEVAWWDREHRAYITSQDVRQIMNRVQLLDDSNLYTTRHQMALEMYWQWVKEYPQASEEFIIEIWFHSASLYLADKNLERTRSTILQTLDFADQNLNTGRFEALQKQYEEDRELLELMPGQLQEDLIARIKQLLENKSRHL